jgi:hypothetical protein
LENVGWRGNKILCERQERKVIRGEGKIWPRRFDLQRFHPLQFIFETQLPHKLSSFCK